MMENFLNNSEGFDIFAEQNNKSTKYFVMYWVFILKLKKSCKKPFCLILYECFNKYYIKVGYWNSQRFLAGLLSFEKKI